MLCTNIHSTAVECAPAARFVDESVRRSTLRARAAVTHTHLCRTIAGVLMDGNDNGNDDDDDGDDAVGTAAARGSRFVLSFELTWRVLLRLRSLENKLLFASHV
jgi:hypothetical protein